MKTFFCLALRFFFIFGPLSLLFCGCQALAPGMTIQTRCRNQFVESKPLGLVPVIEITPELICELEACEQKRCLGTLTSDNAPYDYVVGPHDRLMISVWGHPELNLSSELESFGERTTYVVNGKGNIYFPYVGDVSVAGKTIDQIRTVMAERLSDVVVNPVVIVDVWEFRSQFINVVGEVNLPAMIPLEDIPIKPIDAVGIAGGITPNGDLQHAVLSRDGCLHEINILPSLYNGGIQNLYLKHGDVLYVPNRINNQVYVLGELILPQAIYFDTDQLTLSDAIARSLGLDPFASNPELVYVFREEDNGEKVAYHLDATSPASLLLANDFCLKRQDIIYVGPYRPALLNRIMTNFLSTSRVIVDLARTADHINDIIEGRRAFDNGGDD